MEEFFEGTEKRLDVTFTHSAQSLLEVPTSEWASILALAKCSILNSIENKTCRCFLLSESSFFVWDSRIMLKTCGQIQIFKCIQPFLRTASRLGRIPSFLIYSHRDFSRPMVQPVPHQSREKEYKALQQIIHESFPPGELTQQTKKNYTVFCWGKLKNPGNTFYEMSTRQITETMHNIFAKEKAAHEFDSFVRSLDKDVLIDQYWFSPQGYSTNVLGTFNKQSFYLTLHLTPQPHCGYLSVETNLPLLILNEFLENILKGKGALVSVYF